MLARWATPEVDRHAASRLAEAAGVSPVMARVLMARGIESVEELRVFLAPGEENLLDPMLIKDMDRAVDRLRRAIADKEKVLVFGDYDVDGICSTALLTETLDELGADVSYGLPDRLTEGYGLNVERVRAAAAEGIGLIVTVDNGVTCHDETAVASELGVDVVVVDHHEPDRDRLPDACAVLNPKRADATYPHKDLAGVGLTGKLCETLTGRMPPLDLVALGTVADLVPLRGENRTLVKLGLDEMCSATRLGLEYLAEVARVNLLEMKAYHIGYLLGPRLNAAGRLGRAENVVELLLTDERARAQQIASDLDRLNRERQVTEERIFREAVEMAEQSCYPEQRTILLASPRWHAGVVGIVASRMVEKFNRPTVLLAIEGDRARGSGRSIRSFDLYGALAECAHLIEKLGGHKYAAGLTVHADQIDPLRERFEQVARTALTDDALVAELKIDTWVAPQEISKQLVEELERLEPCGYGNPRPVLALSDAVPTGQIRPMRNDSARFTLRCGDRTFLAVAFRMPELFDVLRARTAIDVAFLPERNVWRGHTEYRLLVRRVRPAGL